MATLHNTIPDESAPLAKPTEKPTSLKRLVAGAAVASFVLGLLAATAITSAAPQMAALSSQEDCNTGSTGFEWCAKQKKCLRPWTVDDWKKTCKKKPKQSCWVDTSGSYHGCDANKQCSGEPKWKCQKVKDPVCNNYCENDGQCVIFGGKTKCSKCVEYGDGVRKWCQEPEEDTCTRECETNYDCANKNGKWTKGCPWMGTCDTKKGECKKTYKDCSSNSDCTADGTKCGPKGFCVGK